MQFTGERVVPGAVEPDLWNEHISRYFFAAQFARNKRALDVGCGTGYGTALIAESADSAIGFDISPEAIEYARSCYGTAATFAVGSAQAFPAEPESFGLITAFEVIEHLPEWPALLSEAARVLTPDGVFLVSTPNKHYYTESREEAGPNPYHVHEFDAAEFEAALKQVFPCVEIFAQNQQQTMAFAAEQVGAGGSFFAAKPEISDSHFFIGICGKAPFTVPPFAYVENSGNLLRQREHYILSLKTELAESRRQFTVLHHEHENLQEELKKQNAWAQSLDVELATARKKLDELHDELEKRTAWARNLDSEIENLRPQLESANYENAALKAELESANSGNAALKDALESAKSASVAFEATLSAIRASRWHRLGNRLGLGPKLPS